MDPSLPGRGKGGGWEGEGVEGGRGGRRGEEGVLRESGVRF